MNKIISFVLLCAILLMCFSGCVYVKEHFDKDGANKEFEKTEPENSDEVGSGTLTELQSQDSLVCTLIEYLEHVHAEHFLPDNSTAIKIDEIKNGKQALHVGFNNSEYYFVCAYYNTVHNNESINYCCVTNYTWVKFNNVNEIVEKYKDLNFVVGFQINKASFITDIITKDATVPNIEHFMKYTPDFNNGLNANEAISFDTSFIYLNSNNDTTIYHSISAYYHILKIIPCISIDEQYYVTLLSYQGYNFDAVDPNSNFIHSDFGKYYDILISKIERHREISLIDGTATFYWIIRVDNFANCISNYGEE